MTIQAEEAVPFQDLQEHQVEWGKDLRGCFVRVLQGQDDGTTTITPLDRADSWDVAGVERVKALYQEIHHALRTGEGSERVRVG